MYMGPIRIWDPRTSQAIEVYLPSWVREWDRSLDILSRGIPGTMAALGLRHFLNYFGCKLVLYIHRVAMARGVTIGTTHLLNVFQAVTISPRNSRWAELNVKIPKYVGPFNILCGILHMLVNFIFPIFVTGKWRNKTILRKMVLDTILLRFTTKSQTPYMQHWYPFMMFCVWDSCGSKVFILYQHRQLVQYIHRTKVSPRSFPETRVTQTILVLVSTFVSF